VLHGKLVLQDETGISVSQHGMSIAGNNLQLKLDNFCIIND